MRDFLWLFFFTFNFAVMSNHYFQFKQFKIEQEKCAMKVCTDSCLFGAWIKVNESVKSILDIGTGTGLLSLMLAQKSAAHVHGIEIDENAFLQTSENFQNSIWKNRLNAYHGDVKTFNFSQTFDFIVCNPPFYENEVDSKMHEEKIAKHSLHLTLSYLMSAIENLLKADGKFAILLPYYRKDEFEKLAAQHSFYPEQTLFIKQTPAHDFFRYAAVFTKENSTNNQHEEISIKAKGNVYSDEAIALLKPYYLYL